MEQTSFEDCNDYEEALRMDSGLIEVEVCNMRCEICGCPSDSAFCSEGCYEEAVRRDNALLEGRD